jgi:hypothetical protein
MVSETGCPDEDRQWLEQYVKTLGYGSVSEAQEALLKDPYKPGLLGDPFAPKFLDTMEEWLRGLRDSLLLITPSTSQPPAPAPMSSGMVIEPDAIARIDLGSTKRPRVECSPAPS